MIWLSYLICAPIGIFMLAIGYHLMERDKAFDKIIYKLDAFYAGLVVCAYILPAMFLIIFPPAGLVTIAIMPILFILSIPTKKLCIVFLNLTKSTSDKIDNLYQCYEKISQENK